MKKNVCIRFDQEDFENVREIENALYSLFPGIKINRSKIIGASLYWYKLECVKFVEKLKEVK